MEPAENPENQNPDEHDGQDGQAEQDDSGRVEAAKRDILTRVARGRLSPDQAADELSRLDRLGAAALGPDQGPAGPAPPPPGDASGWEGRPSSEPTGAGTGPGPSSAASGSGSGSATSTATATASAPPSESVRCVRVVGAFRALRVVGDPDVREAVAEGPHRVRREGDSLLIESEPADMFPGSYAFGDWRRQRGWSGRGGPGPGPFGGFGGFGGLATVPVTVRMHPDIALDAELHAGSLSVRGVRAAVRAHVAAGTVRIEGVAAPVDISVTAGTVVVSGVLDRGESKIECDAGKVRVNLERGSSVRVKARADVGRVDVPGAGAGATEWLLGGGHESTVGSGSGELSIRVSMGAVQVFAEP